MKNHKPIHLEAVCGNSPTEEDPKVWRVQSSPAKSQLQKIENFCQSKVSRLKGSNRRPKIGAKNAFIRRARIEKLWKAKLMRA
jgi:hypothetical protein